MSWKQLRVSIGIVGCVNTNLYIPSNYFKLVGNQPSIKTLVIRFAIRYYAISMFRPDRPLPPPLSTPPSIKVVKVDEETREIRIKRFVRFEKYRARVCCRICGNIVANFFQFSLETFYHFLLSFFSFENGHDYHFTPCVVAVLFCVWLRKSRFTINSWRLFIHIWYLFFEFKIFLRISSKDYIKLAP